MPVGGGEGVQPSVYLHELLPGLRNAEHRFHVRVPEAWLQRVADACDAACGHARVAAHEAGEAVGAARSVRSHMEDLLEAAEVHKAEIRTGVAALSAALELVGSGRDATLVGSRCLC